MATLVLVRKVVPTIITGPRRSRCNGPLAAEFLDHAVHLRRDFRGVSGIVLFGLLFCDEHVTVAVLTRSAIVIEWNRYEGYFAQETHPGWPTALARPLGFARPRPALRASTANPEHRLGRLRSSAKATCRH